MSPQTKAANTETPELLAGFTLSYSLGQFVSLKSGHVGHINSLSYDRQTGLPHAHVFLIEPIKLPAICIGGAEFSAYDIWDQIVPLTDLRPADENAELRRRLCDTLLNTKKFLLQFGDDQPNQVDAASASTLLKEIRNTLQLINADH